MVFNLVNRVSPTGKGYILMAAGILLLLHTLGVVVSGINILLIVGSLYMIVYGFIKADCQTKLRTLFNRAHKKGGPF
jgi:hypothetical protein